MNCPIPWLVRSVRVEAPGTGRQAGDDALVLSHPPLVAELAAYEQELLRVNRVLGTLIRVTETLIRSADEQQLLEETCRLVVDIGGYLFAWIGYVQFDKEQSVWPVARFGDDGGYLDAARISWNEENERGNGPTGITVRTCRAHIGHFENSDHDEAPWREGALKSGFRSSLSLPLVVSGRLVGVLNLYSADTDAFDDHEMALLENLARIVAYGIEIHRMQYERRRAERELKESEGRYRALVEQAPDAIIVHAQGSIIFSNSAANCLFRVTPETRLVGTDIYDLISFTNDPQNPVISTEESDTPAERTMFRLDRTSFEAEVTSAPIILHGIRATQVFIRDITERKQVQSQLIQAAKLATLGEVAAGMAHELSQPTNIIRLAAEGSLLMIDRGKADQGYQSKQFSLIADQAGRMAEIIDHIRIFSRKDTSNVVTFDARAPVQLAIELLQPQIEVGGIKIKLSLSRLPCPVRGRPVQLEQVIFNLLSNAADSIRTARAQHASTLPGLIKVQARIVDTDWMTIMVSDNGTGVPPHDLERIFEPFFTTKPAGHGTGLGLSVSFGIIATMGGRLAARNISTGGARFTIHLPLTRGSLSERIAPQIAPPPSVKLAPAEGRRVLVVDDEVKATESVAEYLTEIGYTVGTAYSGNTALDLFQRDTFDIVVTDIRMPDGDGEQLIEALEKTGRHVPIVVVTGHIGATEKLKHDAGDRRMAIMTKPVSLAQLADTMERLLQNR